MFIHLFKYKCKKILNTRETTFWSFLFPILLGTFFYLAFGSWLKDGDYDPVPVAVVYEDVTASREEDAYIFPMVIDAVSDGEDALFKVREASGEKAEKLLKSKKIDGIIVVGEKISLQVASEGTNQTIIKCFLDEYTRTMEVMADIIQDNPQELSALISGLQERVDYAVETSLVETGGNTNGLIQYFYSLLAMSCLYACFPGVDCAVEMQAAVTGVAARKGVSPVHRLCLVAAEFLATSLFAFVSSVVAFLYLTQVLHVDFGTHTAGILLTCLAGDLVGVAMGIIAGSIKNCSESMKTSVVLAISMLCCFMSGLMVDGIKGTIERHAPVLNRINPAAVISDCFYALNMYEGSSRFMGDICILYAMAVILCIAGYVFLRKRQWR